MKNFDESRAARRRTREERTFQLCGEEFVVKKAVRPDALVMFEQISDDVTSSDAVSALDDLILTLIDSADDSHSRYRHIREDETEDPLTVEDLWELVDWMIEVSTGRPTGQPSVSTDGRGATGTTSTDDSSSQGSTAALEG